MEQGDGGEDLNAQTVTQVRQTILKMLAKWGPLAIVPAIIVAVLLLLFLNGGALVFLFNLFFGFEKQHNFFYQTLGMNDAWSTVLARVMQFVTALAWVPLLLFFPRHRFEPRTIGIYFLAFLAIYVANPLLKATAGSDVCFDQKTGAPIKWYVVEANGRITLYDSDGYDQNGVRKQIATTQICQTYRAQKHGLVPKLLSGDPRTLTFFDTNGNSKVWYDRGSNNEFRLFDAPGYDPNTGAKLSPVTPEIRTDIVNIYEQAAPQPRQKLDSAPQGTGVRKLHKRRAPRYRAPPRTLEGQNADADQDPQGGQERVLRDDRRRSSWRRNCTVLPSGETVCPTDH